MTRRRFGFGGERSKARGGNKNVNMFFEGRYGFEDTGYFAVEFRDI